MHHLKLGYQDIENMPWDYIEWFYNRQLQYEVDLQKAQDEQSNRFI